MTIFLPRGLPARQTRSLAFSPLTLLTRADYQRLLQVSHNTAKRELGAARPHRKTSATTGP